MNLENNEKPSQLMFWGCFIALITTAFAFISRAFMINTPEMWPADFGLDNVQAQTLFGHGIWPFAISIILFSFIIDQIGYRVAMIFSFVCYAIYAALALYAYSIVNATGLEGAALLEAQASGYQILVWGSIILGLGNGTVEAFINPVVATMFNKEKTKWLNILHAGWPGGLVLGGLITLALGQSALDDWRLLIYIIAIPAVVYLMMLIGAKFPINERVSSGATYKEMLAEFGAVGCLIAAFLIFWQLAGVAAAPLGLEGEVFSGFNMAQVIAMVAIVASVIGYGVYCQSLGRPLMIFLCLVMIPLATTELGTDAAITGIMEEPMKASGYSPLWVLIYTSAIMCVLRFFAGPVVKALTPLGLLACCASLAIVGLYCLSFTQTFFAIFAAATLYGVAKTYFWPTTLGVVAEQFPKGGALTLNAIAGIGMLAVGIVGGPLIGKMQEDSAQVAVIEQKTDAFAERVSKDDKYFLGAYKAIDADKVKQLPKAEMEEVNEIISTAKQGALAKIAIFPAIMLLCYLGLLAYFKSKGGYKPATIDGHPAEGH
ncbi:MAG: sugar MFS transporter [Mariniblastus sp.]